VKKSENTLRFLKVIPPDVVAQLSLYDENKEA
jgi:hypothetical protein